MLPFRITRRSLRVYIFLVIFAFTLIVFTLLPNESVDGTPLTSNFTAYLPHAYQAHWSAPAPEFNSWDLDSNTLYPEPSPARPAHTFRPDGLLQVHPGGRHPILDLIEHAEKEWDAKLARASKTLPDAVREYRRRYSRAPPPGFDKWYVPLLPLNPRVNTVTTGGPMSKSTTSSSQTNTIRSISISPLSGA
jgi:hypothetical protein